MESRQVKSEACERGGDGGVRGVGRSPAPHLISAMELYSEIQKAFRDFAKV